MTEAQNLIDRDACKDCRENFTKKIDEMQRVTEKRLDAHADQNDKLDRLLVEVVTLQKIQLTNQGLQEQRIKNLEIDAIKVAATTVANSEAEKSKQSGVPFWREKWFSIFIITSCIILIVLVGAAIGQNILSLIFDSGVLS